MSINKEQMRDIYTRMCRIRAFETAAARLFAEGKIYGFAHLYCDCSGRVRVPAGG